MKRLFVGGSADGRWLEVDPGKEVVRLIHPEPPFAGILTRPLVPEETITIVEEFYRRNQVWGTKIVPPDAPGDIPHWESYVIDEYYVPVDTQGDEAVHLLINGYAPPQGRPPRSEIGLDARPRPLVG